MFKNLLKIDKKTSKKDYIISLQVDTFFQQSKMNQDFTNSEFSGKIARGFEFAISEARESLMSYQLGSVIFSGGKVVSMGHNTDRSLTKLPHLDLSNSELDYRMKSSGSLVCSSLHAEISALKNLNRNNLKISPSNGYRLLQFQSKQRREK